MFANVAKPLCFSNSSTSLTSLLLYYFYYSNFFATLLLYYSTSVGTGFESDAYRIFFDAYRF